MYHIIVAESKDDYLDYINVYNLEGDICEFANTQNLNILFEYDFILHITKFASQKDELKILFMDVQFKLLSFVDSIETMFETESDRIVVKNTTP